VVRKEVKKSFRNANKKTANKKAAPSAAFLFIKDGRRFALPILN
jgi:hypothetical protein